MPALHLHTRLLAAACLSCALAAGSVGLTGCSPQSDEPVRDSREALGTYVTITAYGADKRAIQRKIDDAFRAIASAEAQLSAYPDLAANPTHDTSPYALEVTSVAQFNLDPYRWHVLPSAANKVLDRVATLGVSSFFSPSMLRVIQLYDFEGGGTVPAADALSRAVSAASSLESRATASGVEYRFAEPSASTAPGAERLPSFAPPRVGLDLSGAAKGFALDAALQVMRDAASSGTVDGALISAGSTTLAAGHKLPTSDAEPWRMGIEDPRDPEKVIGIVECPHAGGGARAGLPLAATVSTSGDYQQSFVRDGVRYHHILDPATGLPARGMRSLTVVGAASGLDSDILSTALFVMGIDRAERYARGHGLGLFVVDSQGRTLIVPGPKNATWTIRRGPK